MTSIEGYIQVEDGVRLFFHKVEGGPQTILVPNGMYYLDDFSRLVGLRTLIFYDVRNRGLSDSITDRNKLLRGIQQDVDDLEAVRRYFGLDRVDLIGHSYIALMLVLYAMKHPSAVNRIVQIGPPQPDAGKQYPPHLTGNDSVLADVFSRIAEMQKQRPENPEEACRQFWSVLRLIYVADPANADKIDWGRCELPNERNVMRYMAEFITPSMQNIHLTEQQLSNVTMPVLIIHGTHDRSAPYGGARDWAMMLTNARLLTVNHAAHAPWIEEPDTVFDAIRCFLEGNWPGAAEHVESLEPPGDPVV